jgi:hypothetical protein
MLHWPAWLQQQQQHCMTRMNMKQAGAVDESQAAWRALTGATNKST